MIHKRGNKNKTAVHKPSVEALWPGRPATFYAPPAARSALYRRMLHAIARHVNPYRPGCLEPRLVKRDPVGYCFLNDSP